MKKGFIVNIEKSTLENTDYRRVLYTTADLQLVLMSIEPGDEIGEETHTLSQFIRIESGAGEVILNKTDKHNLEADQAVIIPAGTTHNVINTGDVPLKLYSIYAPPEHRDGVVHAQKSDQSEEHFDGTTTE